MIFSNCQAVCLRFKSVGGGCECISELLTFDGDAVGSAKSSRPCGQAQGAIRGIQHDAEQQGRL